MMYVMERTDILNVFDARPDTTDFAFCVDVLKVKDPTLVITDVAYTS